MIRRIVCRITVFSLLLLGITFTSCKNGMQDLVKDLNNTLNVQEFDPPAPGDEDFDPDTMLNEKYLVGNDSALCLSAPRANSYRWQIYKITFHSSTMEGFLFDYQDFEEIFIEGIIPVENKNFVLYIPDVRDILVVGTYKLVLTVTDDANNEYKDTASVVVYKPYYPFIE